jgi:Ser/Thr protein kinase RdoA (MazF antagonist)
VARAHTPLRSRAEVRYELEVLRHLGRNGWSVPIPVADLTTVDGRVYSLCTYVPGGPCDTRAEASRARGAMLARLHVALLPLLDRLGQRPCWRAKPDLDDPRLQPAQKDGLDLLRSAEPSLAAEVDHAEAAARGELAGLRLDALPAFLLHGDFTTSNVRQRRGRPRGVIDFDLCHVGIRPWELAMARPQRAPELLHAYSREAERLGIPLSEEEVAVLPTVYRAFRLGVVAWAIADGARLGRVDAEFIRSQLQKFRAPYVPTTS